MYTQFSSDTIQNGYVLGFYYGVDVTGSSDIVTAMQTADAVRDGILLGGSKDQLTGSTAEQNGADGVYDYGTGDTIKADHLLNNTSYGVHEQGSGALISGNFANGNGDGNGTDGIYVRGSFPPSLLTGNTANENGAFGINAPSPSMDGGGNKAHGNTDQAQCLAVVCF